MANNSRPIIAVDFDDTIAVNAFPYCGPPVPGALFFLLEARAQGAYLILSTCRGGEYLVKAIDWCKQYGIEFDQYNQQMPGLDIPDLSEKIFANLSIDDKALGTPLAFQDGRHVVDWAEAGPVLLDYIAAWKTRKGIA